MSAELDSFKSKVDDSDSSMEESSTEQSDGNTTKTPAEQVTEFKSDCLETDAVEFLLSNSEYHDCFLTIGNPETDKIEKIGAASLYLRANSPVFRNILRGYKQADLPNTNIVVSDISPATFKLMLRFLYGGKLPKMTAIETAGLALCAEKYKIPRLVQKTLKRLMPTSADDVFPALICVTYASFPDLEVEVCKIIQKDTHKVLESEDFLKLDEASLIFILKQNAMDIYEVELWKCVVRWAEHQVKKNPARTIRECLTKILEHVRFLTFTSEEITELVLPTQILTPEEFVDLALAVSKNRELQSPVLCKIKEERGIYEEETVEQGENEEAQFNLNIAESKTDDATESQNKSAQKLEIADFDQLCTFKVSDHFKVAIKDRISCISYLIITPNKPIQLKSLTCKSHRGLPNSGNRYKCNIKITRKDKSSGFGGRIVCFVDSNLRQEVTIEGSALSQNEIVLPVKFNSGKPIVMTPDQRWSFELHWERNQPVHDLLVPDDTWGDVIANGTNIEDEDITVGYNNQPFHVVQIAYKKQSTLESQQ